MMTLAVIDNYDSFTYNLVHMFKDIGAEVSVFRNDSFELSRLECFDKIVLSPGPGIPSEAGLLLDVIECYKGTKPILGVCLGHQAIGQVFGAGLVNLRNVFMEWLPSGHNSVLIQYFPDVRSGWRWAVIIVGS